MAVSFSSINSALGTSYTDLAALCKSTAINMWAKFKPIYCSDVGLLKNSRRSNSGHTVSGYNISWGIMKPTSCDWRDYIDLTTGKVKPSRWRYDKPQGGTSSPYRLSDFVEIDDNGNTTGKGYYHHAVCPIEFHFSHDSEIPVPMLSSYPSSNLSFAFTFQNGVTGWNYSTCLYLADIFSAEMHYYPTVVMTCYYNNFVYEYCKSAGDYTKDISWYNQPGRDPYVQVLINTNDFAEAIINDGGASSHTTGALAKGMVWTCCMVLTSLWIEGGKTTHRVSSGHIVRLEYADGVDRRDLAINHTTPLDDIVSMYMTVTLRRSEMGYYYIDTIDITTTTKGVPDLDFRIDASATCLVGTVGGNGWHYKQYETIERWAYFTVHQTGNRYTETKRLYADMPTYNFTGDIGPDTRVAAGSLTFGIGNGIYTSYLTGSWGFNVYDGQQEYSTIAVLKSEQ